MQTEKNTALHSTSLVRDKIQGCLLGGAAGDALGYPIEFLMEDELFNQYGSHGIQSYELDPVRGKALISDDTQMTLFTANGILVADAITSMQGITNMQGNTNMQGITNALRKCIPSAYQDWLCTQEISFEEAFKKLKQCRKPSQSSQISGISWLLDVAELYSCRAPGNTCLSALCQQKKGIGMEAAGDFIHHPQNNSKGCGGVMRVAPLGLKKEPYLQIEELAYEGAEIAAVTHGHSLGYMPAAVLVYIINRIVFPEKEQTLKEIVLEAKEALGKWFAKDPYWHKLTDILDRAVCLAENTKGDLENIHQLGEGWVAEETLGIAVYCALRHQDNFSNGIIAAVNHQGDSDSTGAVTGNILGAWLGYGAIEEKWKKNLELVDVILEMADDLFWGCPLKEHSQGQNKHQDWIRKYVHMQWKKQNEVPSRTELMAVKGDITKNHEVQAIVNAANTSLLGGGGVDGAIHRAAGPQLLAECRQLNGCKTGKAKITKAYQLPCSYIIHTPGPCWNGGRSKEYELLASCYQSCLELAAAHGIRRIAFPSISTGIYHFPLNEAARIAVSTVKEFIHNHPGALDVVKWVLFDDVTFEAYQRELSK